MHEATVVRKDFPLNMKKRPVEPDSGKVAICPDRLGVERTGKRGKQAKKMPALSEKNLAELLKFAKLHLNKP